MGRGSISANYYYPPGWDPSKGGLNKFHGVHALRERAKKIDEGIMVIRFEMPFNVWCDHCNSHVAKGVRYNAEKKAVGKYFTTKIWEFTMNCHLCGGVLVMQTDPEKSDYACISGVHRKVETWDEEDNETLKIISPEEKAKMEADPFYKLEHAIAPDLEKAKTETLPRVAQLKRMCDARSDDGALNRQLRKKFREDKKEAIAKEKAAEEEKARLNLTIDLVPATEDDVDAAKQTTFTGARRHSVFSENKVEKRLGIQSQSIFKIPVTSSRALALMPAAAMAALKKVEEEKKLRMKAVHQQHVLGMNPRLLSSSSSSSSSSSAQQQQQQQQKPTMNLLVTKKSEASEVDDNNTSLIGLADYDSN